MSKSCSRCALFKSVQFAVAMSPSAELACLRSLSPLLACRNRRSKLPTRSPSPSLAVLPLWQVATLLQEFLRRRPDQLADMHRLRRDLGFDKIGASSAAAAAAASSGGGDSV